LERIGDIVRRVGEAHFLEGPPTDDELAEHIADVIPPSLCSYVERYSLSGNVLVVFVTDPVSRQELNLRAPEICRLFNARLGRKALGGIKAKLKR
jgi:hypothetical protein